MPKSAIPFVAALLLTPGIAYAEFPREGIPEVSNGQAQPFVGRWEMGFPLTEDTIYAETLVDCADPVVIEATADAAIHYRSSGGEAVFELGEFSGRTPWFPVAGNSLIAVWVSPDEFYLYTTDNMGSADWDNPHAFRRCP